MKRKVILFLLLLALVCGGAGYWTWQKNSYSKDILKLELLGKEDATVAEEIEYTVKYKNNGDIRLEEAKLIFEYPQYSIVEDNILRKEIDLEDIYPGEEKTISFKTRLLGKEGDIKKANVWLSYKPKNLKAKYESSTSLATRIKSVPLTFEFDMPSRIEPLKDFKFRLNYFSNIDYPILGLRVVADYPSGYEFKESAPRDLEKKEWKVGALNRAEGGRIEVTGQLSGGVGEDELFRAKIGTWRDGEFVVLKEAIKGASIIEPSLDMAQKINSNPKFTASPGDWLHYEVSFKNIGKDSLDSLILINKLEGNFFDFSTIKSDYGSFQPGDNSIIFDWKKVPKLQILSSMEEGSVEFWVKLKDDLGVAKNSEIKNTITLNQAREEFVTKVNSKIFLSQRGYFQDEIFGNDGPIPPQTGSETTYTIMWQVKNYSNDVNNAKVKAVLSEGVRLTGKIFPEDQSSKLAFDSQSREIVWAVGDLKAGEGIMTSAPNISFQISFTPSEAQKGKLAQLIGEASLMGEDAWTKGNLETKSPAIDTVLPDDLTVNEKEGTIQ